MPDYEPTDSAPGARSGDEVRALREELRGVFSGRNGEYAMRRDRYLGKHWGDANNPNPDGNRYTITLNYIRPTVDKTVQTLLGALPGIQVMPPGVDQTAGTIAEGMEGLLYATYEANEAELVLRRAAHNMTLLGRGLAHTWWDPTDEVARFRSVAPDNFYPVYDGEEIVECVVVSRRNTSALRRRYPKLEGKIKADDVGDDVFDAGRWARMIGGQIDSLGEGGGLTHHSAPTPISAMTTVIDWYDKFGNWTRVMGDAVHQQKLGVKLGRIPFVEFLNSLPGDEREPRSEIDDIIDLNLYLDQLASQQADIIKRYSNPTILDKQSGQGAQQIRQTVQGEGGVLPIRRDGNIELLNWTGTPPDISQQWQRAMQALYDLSGQPASAYGQLMSNQSGVSTNMALSPQTSRNQEHQGVFALGLVQLNKMILQMNEKFMDGKPIEVRCTVPARPGTTSWRYYDIKIMGSDIGGWYKTRIKWPSALRTDDPIYVQNEMTKARGDGQNPPMQSQYTTMENLGIEDVEEERRRIAVELEDPRLHPERLTAAVNAASTMQQSMVQGPQAGFDPAMDPSAAPMPAGSPSPDAGAALEAAGNPAGPKSQPGGGRTGGY